MVHIGCICHILLNVRIKIKNIIYNSSHRELGPPVVGCVYMYVCMWMGGGLKLKSHPWGELERGVHKVQYCSFPFIIVAGDSCGI